MAFAANGDLQIYYDTFGDADGAPVVLLCGLGSQVLFWHDEFCNSLVDRGFYVVRVDNRDGGLSTQLAADAAYSLSDMAGDIIAVLDTLSIDAAHAVGQSLGGMIAQTLAIEHRRRVLSLTSISSSTGNLDYGKPTDEAFAALTAPAPIERAERIARDVANRRLWASPTFFDEDEARAYFERALDRAYSPTGSLRQFNAILSSGSRDDALRGLDVPALIVHGALDPLIGSDAGAHAASLIAGAELLLIDGMGHDLPVQTWQQIISAITALAARASC